MWCIPRRFAHLQLDAKHAAAQRLMKYWGLAQMLSQQPVAPRASRCGHAHHAESLQSRISLGHWDLDPPSGGRSDAAIPRLENLKDILKLIEDFHIDQAVAVLQDVVGWAFLA